MPVWLLAFVTVLGLGVSLPVWAQPLAPDPQAQLLQQQKSSYYTQIEYQRCRSDVVEVLVKSEALEQRAKALEDEVRKLTQELTMLRGAGGEKPAN